MIDEWFHIRNEWPSEVFGGRAETAGADPRRVCSVTPFCGRTRTIYSPPGTERCIKPFNQTKKYFLNLALLTQRNNSKHNFFRGRLSTWVNIPCSSDRRQQCGLPSLRCQGRAPAPRIFELIVDEYFPKLSKIVFHLSKDRIYVICRSCVWLLSEQQSSNSEGEPALRKRVFTI